GVGSTFTVTIAAPPVDHDVAPPIDLDGFAVALAVPNRTLREALAVRLRVWGLDVTPYASLADAEASLGAGQRCHALMLDLAAGEVKASGIARLHDARPGLPVVGLASLQQPVSGLPLARRLTKPVKDAALEQALRSVLTPTQEAQAQAGAKTDTEMDAETGALRVLLVEDHRINQKVALRLLERLGIGADLAANGREAVDAVQQHPYDLVLMDVQMPVMDGVEATRAIRQLDLPAQPRIVALTAEAMDGDRAAFLEAGMDDYLSKPFGLDDLAAILDETSRAASSGDPTPGRALGSPGTEPHTIEQRAATSAATVAPLGYQALRTRLAHLVGDDDPVFIRETLTSFLMGGPLLLGEILDALYRDDRAAAQKAAQTLRSSAALLGAEALTEACRGLEAALRAECVPPESPDVQAVQRAYLELQARLDAVLAEAHTQRAAEPDAASPRRAALAELG
ncbi:MAG: response regulator, partial [Bacteroidota bacterium]